ncbi:ubiquitin-conjugating enzyme/RWD-like protein [Haematococcus lacustris]
MAQQPAPVCWILHLVVIHLLSLPQLKQAPQGIASRRARMSGCAASTAATAALGRVFSPSPGRPRHSCRGKFSQFSCYLWPAACALGVHGAVYTDGTLCLDILQDQWSPCHNVCTLLTSIQSLLTDPNCSSPANPEAAQLYNTDRTAFNKRVRRLAQKSIEG